MRKRRYANYIRNCRLRCEKINFLKIETSSIALVRVVEKGGKKSYLDPSLMPLCYMDMHMDGQCC